MLRRNQQLRIQVHQWADGFLFALALWLAHAVRFEIGSWNGDFFPPIKEFYPDYFWLFLVIIPVMPLVLEMEDFYKRQMFSSRIIMVWQLIKSCFLGTVGLIFVLFLMHNSAPARGVLILFGCFGFALIFAKEELVRWTYKSKIGIDNFRKRIILVGTKEDTRRLRSLINTKDEFELCGEFDLNEVSIDKLVSVLHEHSVNGVILSAKHTYFGQVEKAVQACELEGVEACLVADFFQTRISQTSLDEFCGRPVLVFHSGPDTTWSALGKQVIDFVGALFLLVVTSPLLIATAIIIRVTSPGPVFFRQERAGINGKPFTMYKFRSMVTNAEQLKQELASLNEMTGPVFKITNDPRVTRIGRWLRKSSLDEFPQLINVMLGQMSLVGPRPLPIDEVKRFDDLAHRRRLSVKPGLTCLWQISGRNDVSDFKEWVRLDLKYIDTWSLWLDFKILWLTVPVVLFGKGAK